MLQIQYAPSFVRLYSKLSEHLKGEVKEKIKAFQDLTNHKSLKVHKLKGIPNTYSFSVNYKIRIVFEYQDKKSASLLYVGNHDEVY